MKIFIIIASLCLIGAKSECIKDEKSGPRAYICNNLNLESGNPIKLLDFDGPYKSIDVLEITNSSGSIGPKTFSFLPDLEALLVSHSNITSIDQDTITSLSSLETIGFMDSNFPNLDKEVLRSDTLAHVYILRCPNLKLGNEAFSNLKYLEDITIKYQDLKHLSKDLFNGAKSLEKLDISNSHVEEIDLDALQDLKKLESLKLNNNNLKTFDTNILVNNRRLETLVILDNPLESLNLSRLPSRIEDLGLPKQILKKITLNEINKAFPKLETIYIEDSEENNEDLKKGKLKLEEFKDVTESETLDKTFLELAEILHLN